jgi:hypothetical protein
MTITVWNFDQFSRSIRAGTKLSMASPSEPPALSPALPSGLGPGLAPVCGPLGTVVLICDALPR